MSILASDLVRNILTSFAWIFLIGGIGWALAGTTVDILGWKFYPGSWVTGALICLFLFVSGNDEIPRIAFVSWPLISAAVAAIPKFLQDEFRLKIPAPPTRQELVTLTLFSAILSCWFQFHFLIQDWLEDYPSLLAEDFDQSAFVVNLEGDRPIRGETLLEQAETLLRDQLENSTWSEAEQWLYDRRELASPIEPATLNVADLEQQIRSQIAELPENPFWNLDIQIPPGAPDYTLNMRAIWTGPSSEPRGYYVQKTCRIAQAPIIAGANPTSSSRVQITCEPTSPPLSSFTGLAIE